MSRCRLRRIQHANIRGHMSPLVSSTAREQFLPVMENEPSHAFVEERASLRLQTSGDGLREDVDEQLERREGAEESAKDGAPDCSNTSCWLLRRSHLHHSELVQCAVLGSPCLCLIATRQLAKRMVVSCRVTSKDILDRNVRFLGEAGTSWCNTFCPPLRKVTDVAVLQSSKNICESETSMGLKSSSITVSTNWVTSASNVFEPVLRQGAWDRDKQALSSLA